MKYKLIITNFLLKVYDARTISIPFINYSFVLVKPNKTYDTALINHELIHVKQHSQSKFTHIIKYLLNTDYRYKCELEAYAVQLVVLNLINKDEYLINIKLKSFSEFLHKNYWLSKFDLDKLTFVEPELTKIQRDLYDEYRIQSKVYNNLSKLLYKNWLI